METDIRPSGDESEFPKTQQEFYDRLKEISKSMENVAALQAEIVDKESPLSKMIDEAGERGWCRPSLVRFAVLEVVPGEER